MVFRPVNSRYLLAVMNHLPDREKRSKKGGALQ